MGGGPGGGILGPGYILTPWPRSSWFEAVKAIINRFINNCTAGRRVAQFVHISANLLLYGSADIYFSSSSNHFSCRGLFGGREFLALPH